MITQIKFKDGSRSNLESFRSDSSLLSSSSSRSSFVTTGRRSSALLRSAENIAMQLSRPLPSEDSSMNEDEAYEKIRDIQETCFDTMSTQRRIRIDMETQRDRIKINKLESESALRTFSQLQDIGVSRLREKLAREIKSQEEFNWHFDSQLAREAKQFEAMQTPINAAVTRVNRVDEDIGNF